MLENTNNGITSDPDQWFAMTFVRFKYPTFHSIADLAVSTIEMARKPPEDFVLVESHCR